MAEQLRIQALTLLGEPRVIVPVPGAVNLCGLCCDGQRVYVSDMDAHLVHVLRLTHQEPSRHEKRRRAGAVVEASMAANADGPLEATSASPMPEGPPGSLGLGLGSLLGFDGCLQGRCGSEACLSCGQGAHGAPEGGGRAAQPCEKQQQRDLAVHAVLTGKNLYERLGLPPTCTAQDVEHAVRLTMRLLHPDRSHNLRLQGSVEYLRIEAAFKRVNNIKDARARGWG